MWLAYIGVLKHLLEAFKVRNRAWGACLGVGKHVDGVFSIIIVATIISAIIVYDTQILTASMLNSFVAPI